VRLFTLAEAEALLPQLRAELEAMQSCKRGVDALRGDLTQAVERSAGNGHAGDQRAIEARRREAERLVDELNERMARLAAWGVELKGIDEGLVDFRAEREGRVVYLCWRMGEERIVSWHELDTGYAGRQPL
jgi:hypothetical protein